VIQCHLCAAGFIKVVLYMLFLAIMVKVHTFPLFAIRPMYLTMRSVYRECMWRKFGSARFSQNCRPHLLSTTGRAPSPGGTRMEWGSCCCRECCLQNV